MVNEETPDPRRGTFAEGQAADPEQLEDERYSEGQEELPDSAEKRHHGRYREGVEELPEEDPEKHVEGRFSTGQDDEPPLIKE
jgi:hypothetical protein